MNKELFNKIERGQRAQVLNAEGQVVLDGHIVVIKRTKDSWSLEIWEKDDPKGRTA